MMESAVFLRLAVADLVLVDGHRAFEEFVRDGFHPARVRELRRLEEQPKRDVVRGDVRQRRNRLMQKLKHLLERGANRPGRHRRRRRRAPRVNSRRAPPGRALARPRGKIRLRRGDERAPEAQRLLRQRRERVS